MSFLRIYELVAISGRQEELRDALDDLANVVREIDGCQSVEFFRDSEAPARHLFIERWIGRDAWVAGKPPKPVFQRLLSVSAGPPTLVGAFFPA